MLPTLFDMELDASFELLPSLDSLVAPDEDFIGSLSPLEIIAGISPALENLLVLGLEELESATGELTITDGAAEATLTTEAGETFFGSFNAPLFLEEFGTSLSEASGSLSLIDGFVDATLDFDDQLYTVDDFNLAEFSGNGLEYLASSINATLPFADGEVFISAATPFGPVDGILDFADGDLDLALTTFAGDIDFSYAFDPEDTFEFAIPSPVGDVNGVINLFTGKIEVPFLGSTIEIDLRDLAGELTLAEGTGTLSIDSEFGPITTSFEVGSLVNDLAVDALTGLRVDANLAGGELGLLATRGTEEFETSVDLIALNNQVIDLLLTTDGTFSLDEGLFSGELTVGDDLFVVNETIGDIANLLATPIGELLSPPAAV